MIATAEPDMQVDDVIGQKYEPETTAVSKLECPIALPVVNDLRAKYGELMIAGIDDKAGLSAVDEARKHCKRVRLLVENWRKEQNEDALKHQRRVNAAAKLIREPLELLEEQLAGKQKAITDEQDRLKKEADDKLKAEKAAKLKARMDSLQAVRAYLPPDEVEAMGDAAFLTLLSMKRSENENRIENEKAEQQRRDEEAERQCEQQRQLDEQAERLRQQQEELDRREQEQAEREAEAQRKIDDEKARLAKVESDRLAAIEREREEAETQEAIRLADEKHAADMAEASRVKAEREEADRIRAEQLRPDKEKLLAFAETIDALAIPDVPSLSAGVVEQIKFALAVAAQKVRKLAES